MICPAETPEGQSVGLVKNLSLMAVVSVQEPTHNIETILTELGMEDLSDPEQVSISTKIFINGNWVGLYRDGAKLMRNFK